MNIDPAKRVMYVTMGTSLFHSATWEPTEEIRGLVQGYEEWTQGEPDPRTRPDLRLIHPAAQRIREGLRSHLRANNAGSWAKWLPQDLLAGSPAPGTLLRYSAELTTILRMSESRPPGSSLADFLNGYAEIRFVYDDKGPPDGGPNLPFVATAHLVHYVNLLAQQERARGVPVSGLSSTNPDDVLQGLESFAKEISAAMERFRWFDFISSGGYKLYGAFLADFRHVPSMSARLIYLHEDGEGLFFSLPMHKEPTPFNRDESSAVRASWGRWGQWS